MKKKTINLLPFIGFLLTGILFLVVRATAQTASDSATVNTLSGGGLIAESWKPYIFAAIGVYELIARLAPTVKNYSISGLLIKVFQMVLPNRNAKVPAAPHP